MPVHSKAVTYNKGDKGMTTYYIRGSTIWLNYYAEGVRIQKSTGLKNTPKNIQVVTSKIMPALDIKIATGEIYKKKPKTFDYYGSIFLKYKKNNKSYFSKLPKWERVIEFFKNRNIDTITRLEIKEYFNSLSIKTASKGPYKSCISEVFELAVDDGVISFNPSINIKLPKDEKEAILYYRAEEVNILIHSARGLFKVYLQIAFNTGMRSGEILGLQLGDFQDGKIHIRRTRTKGVTGNGKTWNSKRIIPCPSFVLDSVKNIQENNIFIFGDIDDAGKLDYVWRKCAKDAGVIRYRLYSTRHTYATLMLKDNIVSVNELAGLLGHSSAKTTLDKYAAVVDAKEINLDYDFSLYSDTTVTIENEENSKSLA